MKCRENTHIIPGIGECLMSVTVAILCWTYIKFGTQIDFFLATFTDRMMAIGFSLSICAQRSDM